MLEPFKDKFKILLESKRSLVSELVRIPNRRIYDVDREIENKASFQMLYSHFASTSAMRSVFGETMMWDYFGFGRVAVIREELQAYDLIEWTHTKLASPSCFYFLPRKDKAALLESVRIRYINPIESLAETISKELGQYNAAHIRLGDFLTNYKSDEYQIDIERYRKYVRGIFPDADVPVLIATDGLESKELFEQIFAGYKLTFIDELVFGYYFDEFKMLEYTDFNVLTILNQLLCASSELFIGTYRSTFTTVIHRLRQERYKRSDFNFFPDGRVARLLDANYQIAQDRNGFFQWNKYSVFSEDHNSLGWMREWDFEQTSIDL